MPLMSKALAINNNVRLGGHFKANRGNFLTLGDGIAVMMSEQMQAGLHGRQHLVDRGLPGVHAATARGPCFNRKRTSGLVREKYIDTSQPFARLHFLTHEMTAFVVPFRCGRGAPGSLPRGFTAPRRKVRGRRVVPRRRKRAAEA